MQKLIERPLYLNQLLAFKDTQIIKVIIGIRRCGKYVVYLELLRRGYEVYVGKVDRTEVDFMAINDEGEEYYQGIIIY